MKTFLSILILFSMFTGFKSSDKNHNTFMNKANEKSYKDTSEFLMKKFKDGVNFYATGNEPFWNLEIGKDKFLRFSVLDGITKDFGAVKGEKAMDANIVRYYKKTDSGSFSATIYDEKCFDNMSGEEFKYKVVVEINNQGDKDYKKFEGCGRYVPDYNLNKKWVIKKTGDALVTSSEYVRGLPEINFDVEKERYSGFSGCNRISGSLYCGDGIIRLGNSVSTLMACDDMVREKEFISSLGKTINYKIKDGELILSNPDKELLVFYDPDYNSNENSIADKDSKKIYGLYDIWVLESLNGTPVDVKNYKELPRLELNTDNMSFLGSGGCNRINGKIDVKDNSIKFSDIVSTRMMCPGNYEADFLNALKSVKEWKVENMKLYLTLDGKDIIVLKKID